MCDGGQIPYDCDQVASKLRPITGAARRLFVRAVATGTVFEVVGVETRQSRPRWKDGPVVEEDVYLLVRRVPVVVDNDEPREEGEADA